MAPAPCSECGTARAVILRPKNHRAVCRGCFIRLFEEEVQATIEDNALFSRGEHIAIGASGGKDSTVLAAVLSTLNARCGWGLRLSLLSIDEGIAGYRDDSLESVKRNAAALGLPLTIVGYKELYGWTMDEVVAQTGRKGNCTYCGVFRRQALDRGAERLAVQHVVTGHNADDVAETVMMNLLRGDLARLARATAIVTASASSPVKRSKPLKYAYEKEIVLYAHHLKLDYFSTECIYSPEAFRGSARALIKNLERIRPTAILDVVRSGEDMARCVPPEVTDSGAGGKMGACAEHKSENKETGRERPEARDPNADTAKRGAQVDQEDDEEQLGGGGCGSTNGRASGGEMADMERRLRENERAESAALETEITSASLGLTPTRKLCNGDPDASTGTASPNDEPASSTLEPETERNNSVAPIRTARKRELYAPPRKLPKQRLGHCQRCGYMSSQAVCKACTLLEGLNRNRPRTEVEIQIGAEEEDSSSSLMRAMESVAIAGAGGPG